jgi:hypothetical protein
VKRIAVVRFDPTTHVLTYRVFFTRPVRRVRRRDFQIFTTGNLTGAGISRITRGGRRWAVEVYVGQGPGTIKLKLKDRNTIRDQIGNPLGGPALGDGDFKVRRPYYVAELSSVSL